LRLAQIRDFVAVAENGSLRSAARSVGVSQPAITKSIRQLEDELQVKLLQRSSRGAVTTLAGKSFLARARVVQAELRKAAEDFHAMRGGAGGSVAFGVAPQICMLLVPEALAQFRRRHAEARVRIVEGVSTGLVEGVRDETLDFSIGMRSSKPPEPALRFRPLLRPQLVVAGRKGHPLARAGSLRELEQASWLMYYPLGAGAMLEQAFTSAGVAMPKAIVQCESYATALAVLAATDTLGLLIPQMLQDPYGRERLQRIAVQETIPAPVIGMFWRADAPLTPVAAAMAQAITAVARRLARS
jgi:LysR family transcriptional regulator, regulator of abg operon